MSRPIKLLMSIVLALGVSAPALAQWSGGCDTKTDAFTDEKTTACTAMYNDRILIMFMTQGNTLHMSFGEVRSGMRPTANTLLARIDGNDLIDLKKLGSIEPGAYSVTVLVTRRSSEFARLVQEMQKGKSMKIRLTNPSTRDFDVPLDGFASVWDEFVEHRRPPWVAD